MVATAFALGVGLVGLMLAYTRRRGVVDVPNHRSSHAVPTPRGGGVGMVAATLLVGLLALPRGGLALPAVAALFVILCLVGWRDDRGGVSIAVRFAVHLLCGCAVAALVAGTQPVRWLPVVPWMAAWALWTASSINIVNFMDGIDGLVASQAVVFALGALLVLPPGSAGGIAAATLLGAAGGFLVWNWSPAKIFLGDSGSGPLGMAIATVGALATPSRREAPVVFLPLFFLFLDSLLTMLRRRRRGERLTEAHRSHLYQRLTRAGWTHARVSGTYALVAAPGAALAALVPHADARLLLAAVAIYVTACVVLWHRLDRVAGERP